MFKKKLAIIIALFCALGVFAFTACDDVNDNDDRNYTITYELAGGELGADAITEYKNSDEPILLPIPTKTGYIFVGWKDGESDPITSLAAGTVGNKNFVAIWKVKTYTVIFNNINPYSTYLTAWVEGDVPFGTKTVEVNYNETITAPRIKDDNISEENKEGYDYIFRYWYYLDDDGKETVIDFTKPFNYENIAVSGTTITLYVLVEILNAGPY